MQTDAKSSLHVVFLGDSLTEGWGQLPRESFPARLQTMLNQAGENIRISNFGVSGDTTGDALARLPHALADNPSIVVVALGVNDAYQGIPVEIATSNLIDICEGVMGGHANLILAGAFAPVSHGDMQRDAFRDMYFFLSERFHAELLPDMLDGIAGDPALTHPDGLHPNAAGYERMAVRFFALVSDVISKRRLLERRS